MTRFFYDWEFYENGRMIVPLSHGMCTDASDETLYLVASLHGGSAMMRAVERHPWLSRNVLPEVLRANQAGEAIPIDDFGPRILDYVRRHAGPEATREDVELWAYYGAYDHVCLAQRFGPMVALPQPIPMFTHDLQQEIDRLGTCRDELPSNLDAHNALADAQWVRLTCQELGVLGRCW